MATAVRDSIPTRARGLPIRLRLALGYSLLLLTIVGGIAFFVLATLSENLVREIDETLSLRAEQVVREVTPDDGPIDLGRLGLSVAGLSVIDEFAKPAVYVEVLDQRGRRVASSPNLPGGSLPGAELLAASALLGEESYVTASIGGERVRVFARPISSRGHIAGVVLVGESLHLLDATLRRAESLLTLAAGIAALAAFAGGWWLTARALEPIAQLTRTARSIESTGRFDQRVPAPRTRDELSELTETFNGMIERIDTVFRRQREFLADASHELRSPLAVIRTNYDLLQLDLPEDERRESAREGAEEVERMSRLISDLLFLSEVDALESVRREPVSLDSAIQSAFEHARDVDGGRHRIGIARLDSASVLGDHDRIDQLIWNLVENALRYTPEGGEVTIALRLQATVVEIAVSDTGIGILPEHLPRLFERFFRTDEARSRERGGTGLGLAIAKRIAEAHGGQIRVRSEPGRGSTFTVVLPSLTA